MQGPVIANIKIFLCVGFKKHIQVILVFNETYIWPRRANIVTLIFKVFL